MKDTPQSLLEDVKNNLPLLYDVAEDYKVSLLSTRKILYTRLSLAKAALLCSVYIDRDITI